MSNEALALTCMVPLMIFCSIWIVAHLRGFPWVPILLAQIGPWLATGFIWLFVYGPVQTVNESGYTVVTAEGGSIGGLSIAVIALMLGGGFLVGLRYGMRRAVAAWYLYALVWLMVAGIDSPFYSEGLCLRDAWNEFSTTGYACAEPMATFSDGTQVSWNWIGALGVWLVALAVFGANADSLMKGGE